MVEPEQSQSQVDPQELTELTKDPQILIPANGKYPTDEELIRSAKAQEDETARIIHHRTAVGGRAG
jgi:hypothetical protein